MNGGEGGGGVRGAPPPPGELSSPQVRELERTLATLRTVINTRPDDGDPLAVVARALLDALTAVARLHHPVLVPYRTGDRVTCARCLHETGVQQTNATGQVPWPCGTLRALLGPTRTVVPPPRAPRRPPAPR